MTSAIRNALRLALPILGIAILTACSSPPKGGYSGPPEHKIATIDAINTALAELPRDVGRPLHWDWGRKRVTLKVVEPDGVDRGVPYIIVDGQRAAGYAVPGRIVVPRGFQQGTLVHEAGHVVLFANGIADTNYHHSLRFFKRHTARQR